MEILDGTLINFLLLKQKDDKYVMKFKKAKKIAESHLGGPIKFTKFIKNNPYYEGEDANIIEEQLTNFKKMQIHSNMDKS